MTTKSHTCKTIDTADAPRFTRATADAPGAIAIIQLHGAKTADLLASLIGRDPQIGLAQLVHFADIDEGLCVLLRDDWAQLFPHGGPRVIQKLTAHLIELGVEPAAHIPARDIYPEAATDLEADMLHALALAASPAAIDLLLDQPRRWHNFLCHSEPSPHADDLLAESHTLAHLITPPSVVLVGAPNVGKSTLSNYAAGRALSITADLPGTTRDWVAGLAELPTAIGELAVRWFDTPGLHHSDDPIERRAIELAARIIVDADVLIAVTEPGVDFPAAEALGRTPDIFVTNKADRMKTRAGLCTHALTGEGFDDLSAAVASHLGLTNLDADRPWAFSTDLRRLLANDDRPALTRYIRSATGGLPASV